MNLELRNAGKETSMKERPILFKGEMVRAILEGRKTQTRRVVKPPKWMGDRQPNIDHHTIKPFRAQGGWHFGAIWKGVECPYGQTGDLLWVRETFAIHPEDGLFLYRCDRGGDYQGAAQGLFKWKPSIFCTRRASRINLAIVEVRVERLQDITEKDALAEGCYRMDNGLFAGEPHRIKGTPTCCTSPVIAYQRLWDSINSKLNRCSGLDYGYPWASNPWVWVVEFRRI